MPLQKIYNEYNTELSQIYTDVLGSFHAHATVTNIADITNVSQDNVISNITFPICHNDNCQVFKQLKYSNFAKCLAIFRFQQQI